MVNLTQYKEHKPVMLLQALEGLDIKPDGVYLDATFGRGGHSKAILSKLNSNGKLLVMDKDPLAIDAAKKLQATDKRVYVYHGSFSKIKEFCNECSVLGKVNGILMDLGVSSPQLDDAKRGFSFMNDGPLDMRMDPSKGISVAKWLENATSDEIIKVLKDFGEEKFAKRIATAIIENREENPITSTETLSTIVATAIPVKEKNKNPATRTFQAFRIFINNELGDLKDVLGECLDVLAEKGRLVVISFHSLEDRIVKRFIQKNEKGDDFPPGFPVMQSQLKPKLKRIGKAIKANESEIEENIRARSAVLRIAEKLKDAA